MHVIYLFLDCYLIVGANNEVSISAELEEINNWSICNNLKLNKNKCKEIIFYQARKESKYIESLHSTPGLERVTTITMLGVTIKSDLSVDEYVDNICTSAAQNFYVIKILQNSGLDKGHIQQVFNSLIVSKLSYASSAWWGFATKQNLTQLQSVLNKAVRWGYCPQSAPSIESIYSQKDDKLFSAILHNEHHVLHHLLPPAKVTRYNLRESTGHGRVLPRKPGCNLGKNFLYRMLYKNVQ